MILLPTWRAQDIDTIDDWKKAEIIFKLLKKKQFIFIMKKKIVRFKLINITN